MVQNVYSNRFYFCGTYPFFYSVIYESVDYHPYIHITLRQYLSLNRHDSFITYVYGRTLKCRDRSVSSYTLLKVLSQQTESLFDPFFWSQR